MIDSAKEKLKGKFLKNIEHDLFTRGQMAAYMNVTMTQLPKANGKKRSRARACPI